MKSINDDVFQTAEFNANLIQGFYKSIPNGADMGSIILSILMFFKCFVNLHIDHTIQKQIFNNAVDFMRSASLAINDVKSNEKH